MPLAAPVRFKSHSPSPTLDQSDEAEASLSLGRYDIAVIGGGIGAVAGDAGKGAAIGASAGAVIDIID